MYWALSVSIGSQLWTLIKIVPRTAVLGTPQCNEKVSIWATICNPLCPKPHFNKTYFTEGQKKSSVSVADGRCCNWIQFFPMKQFLMILFVRCCLNILTPKVGYVYLLHSIHPAISYHLFLDFIIKKILNICLPLSEPSF